MTNTKQKSIVLSRSSIAARTAISELARVGRDIYDTLNFEQCDDNSYLIAEALMLIADDCRDAAVVIAKAEPGSSELHDYLKRYSMQASVLVALSLVAYDTTIDDTVHKHIFSCQRAGIMLAVLLNLVVTDLSRVNPKVTKETIDKYSLDALMQVASEYACYRPFSYMIELLCSVSQRLIVNIDEVIEAAEAVDLSQSLHPVNEPIVQPLAEVTVTQRDSYSAQPVETLTTQSKPVAVKHATPTAEPVRNTENQAPKSSTRSSSIGSLIGMQTNKQKESN